MKNIQSDFDYETILFESNFSDSAEGDSKTMPEYELFENDFLSTKRNEDRYLFYKLSCLCVDLTKRSKGHVSICVYPNANEALIFVTAPSFVFSGSSLGTFYNISLAASKIIIDSEKDFSGSCLAVGFCFDRDDTRIIDAIRKI